MEISFVRKGSTEVRVAELGSFYTIGTVDILQSDADSYVVTLAAEDGNSDPFVVTVNREDEANWLQVGQERRVFNDSFTLHVKATEPEQSVTYRLTVRAEGEGASDDTLFTVES